jgi:hypothetical protein
MTANEFREMLAHLGLSQTAAATRSPRSAMSQPSSLERAFAQRGCPICYGGPGVDYATPKPCKLGGGAVLDDQERHQLTGMPSFPVIEVPHQEIWIITAFMKKLPSISEDDYKAWTARDTPARAR